MPIVDAHNHLGTCRVFDLNATEEDALTSMEEAGVDATIVQPYPGSPDPKATHDAIADFARRNPKKVFGIASLSSHQDPQVYFDEVSRCVRELGFVGVKLHTIGHATNPGGQDATTIFDTAKQLGIPVMMHTGPGIPFAAPSAVIPKLKQFPEVPVVLAHAGWSLFSGEAIEVAQQYPNVSLEPSWCSVAIIKGMVGALGASRVMLGSDLAINLPVMMATFKALGLPQADLDQVLGKNAIDVFKLEL